jgi:hypothetical protein
MSGNSIAISRELLAAGMEQAIAAAVAEAIVTHSDERHATREDMVRLEANLQKQLLKLEAKVDSMGERLDGRVDSLETKLDSFRDETRSNTRLLTVIVVIGILAPYIERAFGG